MLVPVAAVVVLDVQDAVSHEALFGETIERVTPGYFGLMSNLTIVSWLVGGTCACFAAAVEWSNHRRRDDALFLLSFGVWALWLGWDDAYVMHESVIPDRLGIDQRIVAATYVVVTAGLAWRFRRTVMSRDLPLFAVAVACLATSQAIDQLGPAGAHNVLEESLKFVGVFAWSAYLALSAARFVRSEAGIATPLVGSNGDSDGQPGRARDALGRGQGESDSLSTAATRVRPLGRTDE